jgi:hypothetical protein
MLKISVQTLYQPLFSHSFSFSNFPLVILFPAVIFPFNNSFFLPKAPNTKKPKVKESSQTQKTLQTQSQRQKAKAQSKSFFPKAKSKKLSQKPKKAKSQAKAPLPPSRVFHKQQQTGRSREGHDIATGESCVLNSLNTT